MTGRHAAGWQTTLADMSLILFMIASATAATPRAGSGGPMPALGQEVAVFRPGSGPALAQWLAEHGSDGRMRLTIRAAHRPGEAAGAAKAALALAAQAGAAAMPPRIILEESAEPSLEAVLTYDRDPRDMARLLLRHGDETP